MASDASTPTRRRRWKDVAIAATCTAAMIVNSSNNTSLAIALPSIGSDLQVRSDVLQWFVSAYPLSSGCLLLVAGHLADHYGRKRVLVVGSGVLAAFTLGCGFATDGVTLAVLRALQGIGGAATIPAAIGILAHHFPPSSPRARAAAFSSFSAGGPLGAALGMILGGLVTQLSPYKWRAQFWLSAGLAFATLLAAILFIPADHETPAAHPDHPHNDESLPTYPPTQPPTRTSRRTTDWPGVVLSTAGLVFLVTVLSQGCGTGIPPPHPQQNKGLWNMTPPGPRAFSRFSYQRHVNIVDAPVFQLQQAGDSGVLWDLVEETDEYDASPFGLEPPFEELQSLFGTHNDRRGPFPFDADQHDVLPPMLLSPKDGLYDRPDHGPGHHLHHPPGSPQPQHPHGLPKHHMYEADGSHQGVLGFLSRFVFGENLRPQRGPHPHRPDFRGPPFELGGQKGLFRQFPHPPPRHRHGHVHFPSIRDGVPLPNNNGPPRNLSRGWKQPDIIALLVLSIVCLFAFALWEHHLEEVHLQPGGLYYTGLPPAEAFHRTSTSSGPPNLPAHGTNAKDTERPKGIATRLIPRAAAESKFVQVLREYSPPPLLRPSLFLRAKGRVGAVYAVAFLQFAAFMIWAYWVQLYYQVYIGYSPVRTVARLSPMFVTGIICNVVVALVVGRVGTGWLLTAGTLSTAIAALLFALIRPSAPYWAFGFPAAITAVVGVDFLFAAGMMFVSNAVGPQEQSLAGGAFQTMTQLGTSLGVTVSTIVLDTVAASLPRGADPLSAYQAANWTGVAFGLCACLTAFVAFRGVGVGGKNVLDAPPVTIGPPILHAHAAPVTAADKDEEAAGTISEAV
ncbi:MFS domain-containing protein [Mycena chlorophos]|uniref:MFS domain-containing protein n=1 Tax=Mycena chlorophos TaxID=658473 RepID=A0A8H6WNG7_MYCCL|nr:MFS domain-containing protein [Mycena chlorophos]